MYSNHLFTCLSSLPDCDLLENYFICAYVSQCLAHRICSENFWLVKESFAYGSYVNMYWHSTLPRIWILCTLYLPSCHTDLVPSCLSCMPPCPCLHWSSISGLLFSRSNPAHPSKFHSQSP